MDGRATIPNMNRIEKLLLNPVPGSRVEAARLHGVDLTLLIEQLRRTPEERLLRLQQAASGLEALRREVHSKPASQTSLNKE
jgi:hypothetical protein